MKVSICLVCLRATDNEIEVESDTKKHEGASLFTRFLKFAENYLQVRPIPKKQPSEIEDGESFCEKCELEVISPICKLYLDLLSTQLRLSWELGNLGKLMENSQRSTSDKLRSMNLQVITALLGIGNLEQFRSLLAEKCKLNSVHSKR